MLGNKQAVRQFVDVLMAGGAVGRAPDPDDGRGRLFGLSALAVASINGRNGVSRDIERRYPQRLGAERSRRSSRCRRNWQGSSGAPRSSSRVLAVL